MNNSLVDPFVLAHEYPESLTGQLSKALCPCVRQRMTHHTQGQGTQPAFDLTAKATSSHPAGYAHTRQKLCLLWLGSHACKG